MAESILEFPLFVESTLCTEVARPSGAWLPARQDLKSESFEVSGLTVQVRGLDLKFWA